MSLEFRLRTKNPYSDTSRWLSKVNRRGRYWFLPNKTCNTFEDRLSEEIENLKFQNNHKKIISLRRREVTEFLI